MPRYEKSLMHPNTFLLVNDPDTEQEPPKGEGLRSPTFADLFGQPTDDQPDRSPGTVLSEEPKQGLAAPSWDDLFGKSA